MKKRKLFFIFLVILGVSFFVGEKVFKSFFLKKGSIVVNDKEEGVRNNFLKRKNEIFELKSFFSTMVPKNTGVSFGFDGSKDRFYFVTILFDLKTGTTTYPNSGEGLILNSKKMDLLRSSIGWSDEELFSLVSKLKESNCTGVYKKPYNGSSIEITYKYGGYLDVAVYSYHLFDGAITDSLRSHFKNKEGFEIFNDSVVFEYVYPL